MTHEGRLFKTASTPASHIAWQEMSAYQVSASTCPCNQTVLDMEDTHWS